MELHGVTGSPYKHPQVRRTIPVFSRPRIAATGRPVRRSWKDTAVCDLAEGDTVAEFGTVAEVVEFIRPPRPEGVLPEEDLSTHLEWRVRLYNVMGDYVDHPGNQRVYAFTKDTPNG